MNWFVCIIAFTGAVLNVQKKWQGFWCWLISNAWWCWHNIKIEEYEQAITFAIFWLLSAYGLAQWRWPKKAWGDHTGT